MGLDHKGCFKHLEILLDEWPRSFVEILEIAHPFNNKLKKMVI